MGNDQGRTSANSQSTAAAPDFELVLNETFKRHAQQIGESGPLSLQLTQLKDIISCCPELAERLFRQCSVQNGSGDGTIINKENFIKWGTEILSMTGWHEKRDWVCLLYTHGDDKIATTDVRALLKGTLNCQISLWGMKYTEFNADPIIDAMEKSLIGTKDSLSKDDFLYWCGRHCPRLLDAVHCFVSKCLSEEAKKNERDRVVNQATLTGLLSMPTLWALNLYIPAVYTVAATANAAENDNERQTLTYLSGENGWQLLYSSSTQGLSINRFQHHVLSYAAPILVLLRFEGYLYCVGCDEEWCDKPSRWGGLSCFLLQLLPEFKAIQAGDKMIYFNTEDRKSVKGLQVGKDFRTTILQVDEDFTTVKHYGIDCPLQEIEVWGCGDVSALQKQKEQVEWEKKMAQKSKDRKLKLEDWKDSPDRQLMEWGGVKTDHAER